ncbi:hypothetical protein G7Y89_g3275 [Cudoniella acicularis]|uniref:Choline transport protein n=1 Tax=Cudoniella acicularis TaxID=354080 RepID=A0A8H4W648_9HELO|nr:hypothetical protein G7Y89_g3275 [Cudoniella acicularis]
MAAYDMQNLSGSDLHKRLPSAEQEISVSEDRDQLSLARVGKKQVLKRRFGVVSMTGFSCGLMSTWEGLLVGGPAGLIYGLFFVWIGNLCLFTNMGEMSSMIPTAGGQYHWVSILAPAQSRKFLSFLTGWLSVSGWIATMAATSFFVAGLIEAMVTQSNPDFSMTAWQLTFLYWATLLLCVAVNTVLSRALPILEIVILILHLLGFFAILIPMAYLPAHNSASEVFTTWINAGGWNTQALSFFIGLQANAVAFGGADGAIHMSEEIKGATINVPRAMILSVVINGLLAFGMLLVVLFCAVDIPTLAGESTYPFIPIFAAAMQSNTAAIILAAVVLVLQFCASIASLASASRMMWSFSRDRGLPFWEWLSKVNNILFVSACLYVSNFLNICDDTEEHCADRNVSSQVNPRTTIPLIAILVAFTLAALLGLINLGSTTAFNDVIALAIEGLFTTYLLPCGLLLYRRLRGEIGDSANNDEMGTSKTLYTWGPWRVTGLAGILINIFTCIYLVIVCFFSFWPAVLPVTAVNMNYSQLVWGAVILCSMAYYMVKARKVYTGPIVEIDPHVLPSTDIRNNVAS